MTEQLVEIGRRLSALRDIMGVSREEMAEVLGISLTEYLAYEKGEAEFSFSFLYNAAKHLGVDIVDIISGGSPNLSTCSVVRKGEGYSVSRMGTYDYKHLAFTFVNKKAEPFMVTVDPKADGEQLHTHSGQEFNYVVSGQLEFHHDNKVYVLNEGDSVYFDAGFSHTVKALGKKPAQFIAVVVR
jgi:transcriptional regulator with XRE-family HTH domain